ncbi:MAG: hypothetical protein ACYDA3_11345 [Gaiellaceae bacterium]
MKPQFRSAPFATFLIASSLALGAPAALAASSMAPATQTKTTRSYVFKLSIGMSEQMWTPAQAKSKHPKSGEVMIRGAMGGMSMGGSSRHLEVHIRSRSTGKAVTNGHPTITMIDTSVKNAMMRSVPVAVMEGVSAGASDLHYGNNVQMVAGHTFRITVTLNGERAVFRIKVPTA